MATALDVITRSLRKLKVYAAGEDPSSEDADDCLVSLNEMLHAWALDGIGLGHVTLVLTDTLDVPDDHLETIRLSLAERVQGDYGATLAPADVYAADKGRAALRAIYFDIDELGSEQPLSISNLATDW
jgi:hypothetical protein